MADQDGAPKPPVPTKEDLPQELQELPQFVTWRYVERDGKLTKVSYQTNGNRADTTDSQTWITLDEVARYVNTKAPRAGIGYVFSEEDPYCGVDLDYCIDEQGDLKPWAREIIDALDSYAEVSPSGMGVKVIVKATLPPKPDGKTGRRLQLPISNDEMCEIELYDRERFFTLTGNHVDGVIKAVAHAQEAIESILVRVAAPTIGGGITVKPTGLTDEEVVAWVTVHDKNASKFRKLLNGDYSEYGGDESRGDFAAASKIGFYSGDPDQVERIMRNSAMYRDKWDTHATYLRERTIQRAIAGLKETFTPTQAPYPTPEEKAERERQVKQRKADEAWTVCRKLARHSNILDYFVGELKSTGHVGEERNIKLVYVAQTSRLLDRPVSLIVKGPSSTGKNHLVEGVLKAFPDDSYIAFTSISAKALYYHDADYRNKMIYVAEAEGMNDQNLDYAARSLLSEGQLRYLTVETGQRSDGRP